MWMRMYFIEVLNDGHALDERCSIWENKSGYSLYENVFTILGLSCLYCSDLCSPLKRCT